MSIGEFKKLYCSRCGSQRCGGIFDKVWREECSNYKRLIKDERE